MKRFLMVAILALLVAFAFLNKTALSQKVELEFFQYSLTLYFGLWMLIGFLAGLLLVLAFNLPRSLSMRRELRYKSQELARLEFELTRSMPAQSGTGSLPVQPPPPDIGERLRL